METKICHFSDFVPVPAKQFFGTRYATLDLMTQAEVEKRKKEQEAYDRSHGLGDTYTYFESDGIQFYVLHIAKENLNCINEFTPGSMLSGGEIWKFGFVDNKTHEITMCWGNHFVARGRAQARQMFHQLQNWVRIYEKDVTPFATKN